MSCHHYVNDNDIDKETPVIKIEQDNLKEQQQQAANAKEEEQKQESENVMMLNDVNKNTKLLNNVYLRMETLLQTVIRTITPKQVQHQHHHNDSTINTNNNNQERQKQKSNNKRTRSNRQNFFQLRFLNKRTQQQNHQNQQQPQEEQYEGSHRRSLMAKGSNFMTDEEKSQCMHDIDGRTKEIHKRMKMKTTSYYNYVTYVKSIITSPPHPNTTHTSTNAATTTTTTTTATTITTPTPTTTTLTASDENEKDDISKKQIAIGEAGIKLIWNAEELIDSINEYLHIYAELVERDELIITGSKLYTKDESPPCHTIPQTSSSSSQQWLLLSQNEQLIQVEQVAKETIEPMKLLLQRIENIFPKHILLTSIGPIKQRQRIIEKSNRDYKGNILRVIDLVRCSIVLLSLQDCKDIIDWLLQQQQLNEYNNNNNNLWKLIRIKDGFEKVDNYVTGGYRDIKLNLEYIPNGHIIEIQLHLKEFYDLKVNGGGHMHYEFARTLNIDGITDPLQLINHNDIPFIVNYTNDKYSAMTQELNEKHSKFDMVIRDSSSSSSATSNNSSKDETMDQVLSSIKTTVMFVRHLGNLYKSIKDWVKCIELFKRSLEICNEYHTKLINIDKDTANFLINLLAAVSQISLSYCFYEVWTDDVMIYNNNDDDITIDNNADDDKGNNRNNNTTVHLKSLTYSTFQQQQPKSCNDDDQTTCMYDDPTTRSTMKSFVESDILSMIDDATKYFQKEFGLKHPYTLNSMRTKIDISSISSRYQYHHYNKNNMMSKANITNVYNERNTIDQLYKDLLQDQKDVLGNTHPELLVTCHRYGTYMCDSSLLCRNNHNMWNKNNMKNIIDNNDNMIEFSSNLNKDEEIKRYKDGVQLLINGLKCSLPRLGKQNTIFQKYLSSAQHKATLCNDKLLIQQCIELM